MNALLTLSIWVLVALHVAWIACISLGTVLALTGKLRRMPRIEGAYLAVVGVTVLNRLLDPQCWLTKIESALRTQLTGQVMHVGFIEHYLSLAGVRFEQGVLFFVGAGWISAGLLATIIWHGVVPKYQLAGAQ